MSFVLPAGISLERALGRGSVFEVALLLRGTERVVGKRLRSRMLGEEVAEQAFARECAFLGAVAHRSVPKLIEVGKDGAGPYLLQSWVEGASLRDWSAARRSADGGLASELQLALAKKAFCRLAELHALQDGAGPLDLIHGDLSPDHIMVGDDGDVVFIDFGQATGRDMPYPPTVAERGTMPYAAPERLRGEGASQAGDVYALAACFAFLALGEAPGSEAGSDAALLVQLAENGIGSAAIAAVTIPPASGDSPWRRALRVAPEERPDADQVALWLEAAQPALKDPAHSW